jgi:hypothetical protein
MPDCTNVKQSCLRGWIDQDIQIAGFVIIPMKHRTKNTSIASVMALNHCAYGCTVGLQAVDGFMLIFLPSAAAALARVVKVRLASFLSSDLFN